MSAVSEHSSSNRADGGAQSGGVPRAQVRVVEEEFDRLLSDDGAHMGWVHGQPVYTAERLGHLRRIILEQLEGVLSPPQTIDRDALVELIRDETGWDWPGEEDEPEPIFGCDSRVPSSDRVIGELVDAVLALVRPVEGVLLAPEEAQLAAWALREAKGWPPSVRGDFDAAMGWLERRRVLMARMEATS